MLLEAARSLESVPTAPPIGGLLWLTMTERKRWREYLAGPVIYTMIAIIWTLEKLGFKSAPLTKKQKREVFHDIWG
jgi:hypothetical protein